LKFDEFIATYKKAEVLEYGGEMIADPLLSVCVQTYQHAEFIEECLKAILSQEVDFRYEIIIGEDGSTDDTRRICEKFVKAHPGVIRLFSHSRENNIKINGKPSSRFNMLYNLYHARGKFLAFCDGDDYWIDKNKLQKQVDFLKANPEIGMVACEIVMSDGKERKKLNAIQYFAYEDLFRRGFKNFNHSTRVLRSHPIIKDLPAWHFQCNSFDTVMLFITLKYIGSMATLPFQGVCYRVHGAGLFTSLNREQRRALGNKLREVVCENGYFKNKAEELMFIRQWRTRRWFATLTSGRINEGLQLLVQHIRINSLIRFAKKS
jgi:glycosyltransferase involved in cell wall biosynthesis